MNRRITAVLTASLFCLTAFLCSCEKEPEPVEYKPYNYDLASYISIDSVLNVSYTPLDTAVSESEIEYQIIKDVRKAGLYDTDFAHCVLDAPEAETTLLGDRVVITSTATVDGEAFPDAAVTNKTIELGSGAVSVDGFETGLVGVPLNEEITLSLILPADYSDFAYRNRQIEFKVTVTEISRRFLCPDTLTPEQLSKIGGYGDFAEYYEATRIGLTEEKEKRAKEKKIADCWQAVMERVNIIAYPQVEMEMYVEEYLSFMEEQAKENGFKDLDSYAASLNLTSEALRQQGMEYARGDVLQEMVIYYVARAEGFDNMSDELFSKFAAPYAEELGLDNTEQLVAVVGYYNVQKRVLTDVVKQYIADNAVADTEEDAPKDETSSSEE